MSTIFGFNEDQQAANGGIVAFAQARTEFDISEAKNATMASDESKNKMLDTAKIILTVAGERMEVDVMPTIGEEVYDEDNRVPQRNERGTPEEDALRRDLTIGALMLRVESAEAGLSFTLLDYYGGLQDLLPTVGRGRLRSPVPHGLSSAQVAEVVLLNDEDRQLAGAVGITIGGTGEVEQTACQALWWVKVLRDDPLRAVRACRFAAKFGFEMDKTFWLAIPFALDALQSKVAGSRKMTEYRKISKLGFDRLQEFMEMAFGHEFVAAQDGSTARLAPGLFGGNNEKGVPHFLADVASFDADRFARVLRDVPCLKERHLHEDEALGEMLACAILASSFEPRQGDVVVQLSALEQYQEACIGMTVSNIMSNTGMFIINTEAHLRVAKETPYVLKPHDAAFARALQSKGAAEGLSSIEQMDPASFAWHECVWNEIRFPKAPYADTPKEEKGDTEGALLARVQEFEKRQQLIIALLSESCPAAANATRESFALLGDMFPKRFSGKCLGNGKEETLAKVAPMHLRGQFLVWLEVFHRLSTAPGSPECSQTIETPEVLLPFLQGNGLPDLLAEALYEGGQLRIEYGRPQKGKPKKKQKAGPQS